MRGEVAIESFTFNAFSNYGSFMGYQWMAAQNGAVPAYLEEGQAIIPGTQNVFPVNISLIIGGFLFGFGMILSEDVRTLTDFGEGRSFICDINLFHLVNDSWRMGTLHFR